MARVVFLDTMIFLHYRPLVEIDFCGILSAEEVTIVVPRITIRELDLKKNQHPSRKIQDRARASLAKIENAFRGDGVISPKVYVELTKDFPQVDFTSLGLHQDWSDDVLVASVYEYAQSCPDDHISLISRDSGPRFKCDALGIEAIELDDVWKLPAEPTEEEVENKRLKREIDRITNAIPRLRVAILVDGNPSDRGDFTVPKAIPYDAAWSAERLDEARLKYAELRPIDLPPTGPKFLEAPMLGSIKPEEYERYNADLPRYFKEYEEYLSASHEYENALKRTIEFQVVVLNEGTFPAKDVDIALHFPDGFTLSDEGGPYRPDRPAPPKPPQTLAQQVGEAARFNFGIPTPRLPNLGLSSFNITRTNSYDISDHCFQIKHGFKFELPKLFLTFDTWESACSFHCDYTVHAGNLVDPVKGQLHFRIVKSD